jgi:hypothetical protein
VNRSAFPYAFQRFQLRFELALKYFYFKPVLSWTWLRIQRFLRLP